MRTKAEARSKAEHDDPQGKLWELRLYVAGQRVLIGLDLRCADEEG